MTTISEIARAADVSVESVLRVINQDKVSNDIAARVISAMDAYGYRPVPRRERDASESGSAAAPPTPRVSYTTADTRPPPRAVAGEVVVEDTGTRHQEADDAIERAREQLLQAVGEVVDELENPEVRQRASDPLGIRALADRLRVMDARFERLARDIEGIKRELARARTERLEDLTLLVDLITTSWRTADRRLGRIDQKLERMEGLPEPGRGRGVLPRSERPRS